MPGNHSEISLNEQNGFDNDTKKKKTTKKKKKKKDVTIIDDDEFDSTNPLVTPSHSKSKNRFIAKIRKKPKSPKRCCAPPSPCSSSSARSGSRKGGCFRVLRPRRREGDGDGDESPVSDPNDERFSHEMLRVMLETNDFCSDECNPHR